MEKSSQMKQTEKGSVSAQMLVCVIRSSVEEALERFVIVNNLKSMDELVLTDFKQYLAETIYEMPESKIKSQLAAEFAVAEKYLALLGDISFDEIKKNFYYRRVLERYLPFHNPKAEYAVVNRGLGGIFPDAFSRFMDDIWEEFRIWVETQDRALSATKDKAHADMAEDISRVLYGIIIGKLQPECVLTGEIRHDRDYLTAYAPASFKKLLRIQGKRITLKTTDLTNPDLKKAVFWTISIKGAKSE